LVVETGNRPLYNRCMPRSTARALFVVLAIVLAILAPLLASHTRPGGRIALSGILAAQSREATPPMASSEGN